MVRKVLNLIKKMFEPTNKDYLKDSSAFSLIEKISDLQKRVEILESENVETSNTLYELMNSIDAVDARIDILTVQKWTEKDV